MRKKWLFFLAPDGGDAGGGEGGAGGDGGTGGDGGAAGGSKSIFDNPDGGNNPPGDGSGNPAGDGGGAGEVPENYEFNLGEGLTITDEQKTAFTAIAKDAKLSQAQADSLLKMHSEIINGYMHAAEDAVEKNIAECEKLGLTSQENLGFARTAVNTFGGSEAMQVLIDTGAINHPAVCKLFVTIGQLISEDKPADTHVGGGKGTPRAEDILFPNSKY
nr:MAG TPA: putative protease [Caudoviricetes sp.]